MVRGETPPCITLEEQEAALRIRIDGKPFADYVWQDRDVLRPYFARLHAPNGVQVTRNHPPVDGRDAVDHAAMHPGLWLAFGDLGGADFWRNKGVVRHVEFVDRPRSLGRRARFAVRNRYLAGETVVCEELCRIGLRAQRDGTWIDWTSEFRGPAEFVFGDQEEMGLGLRVATPLAVVHGGRIVNSDGAQNERQVWGRQADWCDYRGTVAGEPAGVTLMPDPANFRRCWFHARDYGVLVANPFGQNAFTQGEHSRVVVRPGESLRLRFGVFVHSGEADVAAAFQEWRAEMPWVEVSQDKKGFVLQPTGQAFAPWGFNYDHDEQGRLLEDYWEAEWSKVEADFAEMKGLGANVVRVHLQFGKFMDGPERPNAKALDRLARLVRLAETTGLYLNLTGLGCYHKHDVPGWYDRLSESARWDAQAQFWEAVASRCAESPALFCYDLMNEPVVPGGRRADGDWLGPPFAGKHFVQFITLDQAGRPRPEIARQWVDRLVRAVRRVDPHHLITVGLVDWSLDRKGLTSGFVPEKVAENLDFVSVHLYPESGRFEEASETLKGFAIGKPVVVEETFPLKCSPQALVEFLERSSTDAAGWISFYWGKTPQELRGSSEIADALLLQWLEIFERRARSRPQAP